ncbi:cupin domain-containing protein [Streptomyces sp. NBC_01803]|uniref:cupin domain-containing protein n=1 Tax=Streptomyces sp. NBC_01803 TaxID=2975946 RepID=UPI002DDA06D0|nr:cupin domain-containing protein [Streptomyces sp. NBC_01803]WSA47208.1 cupin domain-containing protein [Streptomyces sp. NBC_01803]
MAARRARAEAVVRAALGAAVAAPAALGGRHAGPGRDRETLAAGRTDERLVIATGTSADVTTRVVTIAPGGSTGRPCHPGQVLAVVASGTLTRTLDDCSLEVSVPGATLLEPAGPRPVHIGRNLGTEPVVCT